MQWRQPPDRVNHLRGDLVEFGRGRSRGRGYLAHSDRVGPGVLLLETEGHRRADSFNAEGFTVLVPEVDLTVGETVAAAAEYLSANWHPRLGVVAVGRSGVDAARALLEREVPFDALVLYGNLWVEGTLPSMPVVGHLSATFDMEQLDAFRAGLQEHGRDPELYLYDDAEPAAQAVEVADARTLDTLEYFLS